MRLIEVYACQLDRLVRARDLRKDDEGAALIEYTVLIALVTVGVIATIGLVGGKVAARWVTLEAAL